MLTLLLGRDWIANRNRILEQIADDVAHGRPNRILLVPELVSHDTERRLAAVSGDTASRYAQVLSFTRLARRICDLAGSGAMECLDNGGRVVAMAAAARQLSSRLKAYASVETKPEFLAELVDAVDEFKRCCISAEDLKIASMQTEGNFAQKLEELSLLLESYDALCSRGKRDPRDQMTWVLEQLEEMDFAQNHVLYVDGFPDFTRQHMAVLAHFIRNSPQVVISLNTDRVDSTDAAFEKAGKTASEILSIARQAGIPVHIHTVDSRDDALESVRKNLFQGKTTYTPALYDRLHLHQVESEYRACQEAARRIIDLTSRGVRYRDIAIAFTDPAKTVPVLRLVMRQCGIPIYLSGTEDVCQSGVIATVLLALDAALGGFEMRMMLRYLRSVLSPLPVELCDRVENYAVIWHITGNRWQETWTGHPKGLSGQWDEAAIHELEELNQAKQMVMQPLLRLREAMREAKNLRQQVLALYDFLQDIHFADRLDAFAQEMDRKEDNRSAQILNQLWEILLGALEQLYDVLGETAWDSENFTRLLRLLLSQYDVGTIPPVLDSVSVGPMNAMRCHQTEHLILLGADEGSLPGYGGAKGLLTDQERVTLRRLGVPLTGGAMDGLQAEFADIYGVFCSARESITVLSSDVQPSFVYRRLASLAGGATPADAGMVNALRSKAAAGAYLASYDAESEAEALGLQEIYLDAWQRKNHRLGVVERENIQKLYGKKLNLSASQIDRQAQCRLSYFLQYGLRAQERKEATVDPAEFGTYVHAVLEKTVRDVMARGGFHQVDLDTTMSIAMEHSAQYADERFSQLDSQRVEYLFRRNMLEMEMVVRELWQELSQAQYAPAHMELSFGMQGQMDAIEIHGSTMDARLRGLVDRVDTWQHGDATFFRVVDYKTGKKDFDYCDVFNGVGLQMLLYLFALEDRGSALIGRRPVSAGVQYFPARAPYVSVDGAMDEEQAEKERKKLTKRSGLLLGNEDSLNAMDPSENLERLGCKRKKDGTISGDLADGEQLGQLKRYLKKYLSAMVDEIASGNINPNPYSRGTSFDACTFCPYGAVCHKNSVPERRNYKKMESQRFWEEIGKEESDHG